MIAKYTPQYLEEENFVNKLFKLYSDVYSPTVAGK